MSHHEDNPPMTPPSRPRNDGCFDRGSIVELRNTAILRGALISFPGSLEHVAGAGLVDTSAFPQSHPDSITPTTIGPGALLDACASDAISHIKEALALAERGHIAEARFEFSQAGLAINEAIGWCK